MLDPLTRYYLGDAGARGPLVLMYHATEPQPGGSPSPWVLPLRLFRDHLQLLDDEGFTVVPLNDVVNDTAPPRSVCITFDDGYVDNLHAAELLSAKGMTASWFIVTGHIGGSSDWGDEQLGRRPMMSATQLRELHSAQMSIGSHTINHPRLPNLTEEQQRVEIEGSRAQLAETLGAAPSYFAYPYGQFTQITENIVASTGYDAALSTRSGYHRGSQEQFRIRRITIYGEDSKRVLARKLALADNTGSWHGMVAMLGSNLARRVGAYRKQRR